MQTHDYSQKALAMLEDCDKVYVIYTARICLTASEVDSKGNLIIPADGLALPEEELVEFQFHHHGQDMIGYTDVDTGVVELFTMTMTEDDNGEGKVGIIKFGDAAFTDVIEVLTSIPHLGSVVIEIPEVLH